MPMMKPLVVCRRRVSKEAAFLSILCTASMVAIAQDVPSAPARGAMAGVTAGGQRGERSFEIEPNVSADLIWTDNAKRNQAGKQSEFTTTLSPGIVARANGRKLKGRVDYRLTRLFRANNTSGDETQHALRSQATLEAVDDHVFVDFAGTISQRAVSAFGQQIDDPYAANANRTEVRTFQLAPYLQGRVGDWADYRVRYSLLASRSKNALASDKDSREARATLRGTRQGTAFNWTVDASRLNADFSQGRNVEADQVRAVLGYRPVPEWNLAVIPGWESNNYASVDKKAKATWGVSADYADPTTKLSALLERRFFGTAHALQFEHRTPRSAWQVRDTKNVNVTPEQVGRARLGLLYDLLYFQFETIEPDPVRRALLVESYMAANGLDRLTPIDVGFQTSGATLQRRQDVSLTLIGLRESLTLLATQTRTSSLFNSSTEGFGDLSNSSFVRQQTYSLSYARRMTNSTSLNMMWSRMKSLGSLSDQSTTLTSYALNLSTQLGQHTSATFGLRRSEFDGIVAPYVANSVHGGVSVRF
jgi:uncharacterized protein (PEP-CTERM system associated)